MIVDLVGDLIYLISQKWGGSGLYKYTLIGSELYGKVSMLLASWASLTFSSFQFHGGFLCGQD